MSLSKLASWMNKTFNNNITFHSSSFLQHLYIYIQCLYFFYVPTLGNNPSTICSILDSNKTCLLC